MVHIAHPSHLGQYLKIFSLYMHFIFICGHNKNSCNVQGRSLSRNSTALYLWFRGGDLNSFRDNKALPVCGGGGFRGTIPYGHDYIPSHVPWHKEHKYIWSVGWDLNGFQDIGALPVYGGRDHSIWSWPTYHQMLLDTINKNIYGLGVEISMIFEILGYFLFKEERGHHVRSWLGLGWGSQWFSRYLGTSCIKGTEPPRNVMTYIPSDVPWHKKQEYV
jgi:hypothetical protein